MREFLAYLVTKSVKHKKKNREKNNFLQKIHADNCGKIFVLNYKNGVRNIFN